MRYIVKRIDTHITRQREWDPLRFVHHLAGVDAPCIVNAVPIVGTSRRRDAYED
jgi:hypothetical protein